MEESKETKEIETCPICLDEIGDKNSCVTECNHKFCLKCLSTALREKNTCPMCRSELVEENEDTKKIRRLEDINRIFAMSSMRKNREIKKYEQIYIRSMMYIQDYQDKLYAQSKEIKHRNLVIKLKNMEINGSDNWRRKWKLISQMATINLDMKHNKFLVIDHNPYDSWNNQLS